MYLVFITRFEDVGLGRDPTPVVFQADNNPDAAEKGKKILREKSDYTAQSSRVYQLHDVGQIKN